MTDEQKELLYDLLTKKAIHGLDPDDQVELDKFDAKLVEGEFRSLEMTAAAVSMASLEIEPMPEQLAARIAQTYAASADLTEQPTRDGAEPGPPTPKIFTAEDVFDTKTRRSAFAWLGWVAAAIAVAALAFNLYTTRFNPPPEQAKTLPVEPPRPVTMAEQREEFLRAAPDVISASWAPGNVKDMRITGDLVWSDARQQGYIRFRNIPVNDAVKTCYQLWIFDQTQEKDKPIDGGIFDVTANGELIIPIKTNLVVAKPEMFALTLERHGGVVVSKREKIAALAKVETHST